MNNLWFDNALFLHVALDVECMLTCESFGSLSPPLELRLETCLPQSVTISQCHFVKHLRFIVCSKWKLVMTTNVSIN